jgi:hypothetical protein
MDTILFLETIVHFHSYERYKVSHTGRIDIPAFLMPKQ